MIFKRYTENNSESNKTQFDWLVGKWNRKNDKDSKKTFENWTKKNKSWLGFLACIICAWFVSVIGIIGIKHWCIGLPWYDSRISLSNALSLGSAIGAIAVAVFAWMAYKYATQQYLKNEIEKIKFEKRYSLLSALIDELLLFNKKHNYIKNYYKKMINELKESNYDICSKRVDYCINKITKLENDLSNMYNSYITDSIDKLGIRIKLHILGNNSDSEKDLRLIINEVQDLIVENKSTKTLNKILDESKNDSELIEQLEHQLIIPSNFQEQIIKILARISKLNPIKPT